MWVKKFRRKSILALTAFFVSAAMRQNARCAVLRLIKTSDIKRSQKYTNRSSWNSNKQFFLFSHHLLFSNVLFQNQSLIQRERYWVMLNHPFVILSVAKNLAVSSYYRVSRFLFWTSAACHFEPFTCHSESFACHSERSEESCSYNTQGKLREAPRSSLIRINSTMNPKIYIYGNAEILRLKASEWHLLIFETLYRLLQGYSYTYL